MEYGGNKCMNFFGTILSLCMYTHTHTYSSLLLFMFTFDVLKMD